MCMWFVKYPSKADSVAKLMARLVLSLAEAQASQRFKGRILLNSLNALIVEICKMISS